MLPLAPLSLNTIKEKAKQLVEKRIISPQQQIYCLCQYIPACEWLELQKILELNEFLIRDRIIDLLAQEKWFHD